MKYFLLMFLSILNVFSSEIPVWFSDMSFPSTHTKLVGYGEEKNLPLAIANAKASISGQIKTQISSNMIQNNTLKNEIYNHEVIQNQQSSTQATMTDTTVLKQEKVGDMWYVAVEFENIPTLQKFINKLPINLTDEPQNSYLMKTELFDELHKTIGKSIDAVLVRKDGAWYLKYKDVLQNIDERNFEDLFTSSKDQNLSLTLNKRIPLLYDGEKFSFTLSSTNDGFVSLLDVFEDGSVAVLSTNIPISKNSLISIPNIKDKNDFEAATLTQGKDSFDLFVAIYSEKPLNLDRFIIADANLQTSENAKSFDKLIGFLNGKQFATLKITTKK